MSQLIKNEEKKAFRYSGDMFDILVMTVLVSAYMMYFDKGFEAPILTIVAAFIGCAFGHYVTVTIIRKYRKK